MESTGAEICSSMRCVIVPWVRNSCVLRIAGQAGTGKTTFAAKLARKMLPYGLTPVFSAFTNKAVVNLRAKGGKPAMTLHQLLRTPTGFRLNPRGDAARIIAANPERAIVLLQPTLRGTRQILPPLDSEIRYGFVYDDHLAEDRKGGSTLVSWNDAGEIFEAEAGSETLITPLPDGAQFFRLPQMNENSRSRPSRNPRSRPSSTSQNACSVCGPISPRNSIP
jgi:hypothetical protein